MERIAEGQLTMTMRAMTRHRAIGRSAATLLLPVLVTVSLLAAGCSSNSASGTSATPLATADTTGAPTETTTPADTTGAPTETTTPADTTGAATETSTPAETSPARPFTIEVPGSYNPEIPAPLLVVLHGYTSSGASIRNYFNLQGLAEERGFLAVYPDGTSDARGQRFWNATNACCNLTSSSVDDSSYLLGIIDEAKKRYAVDPKRVYLLGHSNGGFMSYRMACEHADTIAAIVSLAGATYANPDACNPSEPVGVLQIHGSADAVIPYTGGQILGNAFPSAAETVATWAAYNGCATTPVEAPNRHSLDLEASVEGDDSGATTFAGCRPGGQVELLTIDGGSHSPNLSEQFPSTVIDFLYANPKP